jgi:septal ring factor EnvC (AmiA/AmiB activator)
MTIKLFGLTTVAALKAAQKDRDKWKADFYENNETIERCISRNNALDETIKQLDKDKAELETKLKASLTTNTELEQSLQHLTAENNAIAAKLEAIAAKVEALTQELKDCKSWAEQLQQTNREQADKLGKQVETISNAFEEAAKSSMLVNQATIELSLLKQKNNRYQTAINNLNLEVNN